MYVQNLKFLALPVRETIGGTRKILAVPEYAYTHDPFFQWAFVRMDPVNVLYWPNLKSVALPVPEMIAIEILSGGCEPPI